MHVAATTRITATPHDLRRSVSNTLKGSAGNLVEWFDVYVYSVFAVYFESKFFSPDDKNATLYVWAIFAMTFLMRPIGAGFSAFRITPSCMRMLRFAPGWCVTSPSREAASSLT